MTLRRFLTAAALCVAGAPGLALADTISLPDGPTIDPPSSTTPALGGRVNNRVASCGAKLKADARFDFRRSTDGMDAGSVTIKRGRSVVTALSAGSYDVRVYLYQRKAFRYLTTRHLVIEKAGWQADFGCAAGASEPSLQHRSARPAPSSARTARR